MEYNDILFDWILKNAIYGVIVISLFLNISTGNVYLTEWKFKIA